MANQADKSDALEFPVIWAEHIHSARWFRGVTLLLSLVVLFLLVLLWNEVTEADPQPLVVRVDAVGRARVVDYSLDRATTDQRDPVVPFFLNDFVSSHYSRRHGLGAEDWQRSHAFLTPELSRIAYGRDQDELVNFISSEGQAPEQFVEDVRIRMIPQPEPPFRAEVFFDRVERYFDRDVARYTFSLAVHFEFSDAIPNETRIINPLGIVITYLEAQQEVVAESLRE